MAHDGTHETQEMTPDVAETVSMFLTDPVLLPGEDEMLYRALARAIRQQLDPRNILQRLACDDIVTLRWEILRHRRLRKKSAERWFAGSIVERYRYSSLRRTSGAALTEDELHAHAMDTISVDAERRASAEAFFDEVVQVNRDQMLAEAYAEAPAVKCHDAKLNMLMRQHRQAMKDYEAMKAADARHDIPDAEIVKDAA